MKVFVAGSRKFAEEFNKAMKSFKEAGIVASHGEKNIESEKDTVDSVKMDNERLFKIIDDFDIVYVIAKNGYVGKSVAMELGYAKAKGKEIISSEEIEELSVRNIVDKIMNLKDLIDYLSV